MNYGYLNKFFSKKSFIDTIFDKNFNCEIYTRELYNKYITLNQKYRNEFFFKSTLFNKYVLGKYSLNTTSALSEIPIGNSKADFVIINHNKGIVYEIKTDLDNLDRLIYQLEDYYKVFSEVFVLTTEKNYYPVFKFLKEFRPSVGIIVLTDKVTLSIRKKAIIDESNLKHESLFKLLRRYEYEEILYAKYGRLPDVKPVYYFRNCLKKFKEIDIKEAQILVFNQLRRRKEIEKIAQVKDLPIPIRWLVYSGNFSTKELDEIYKKFKITKGGC